MRGSCARRCIAARAGWLLAAILTACGGQTTMPETNPLESEFWTFDGLSEIGGHAVTVEGDPRVIETEAGKAIAFDGVDDALIVGTHPLEGAETFTWEAVFRPDGGQEEQRWFHLNEEPGTGDDSENRMLFEVRVVEGQWCLDTYVQSGEANATLLDRSHLHPLGEWHHVAAVYDGEMLRSYVNGELDGEAALEFTPHGPGKTSVGVRINRVYYFQGAVRSARFTRQALAPAEFQGVPGR